MGEGGWTAIEIIIVLILVIALLGRITGKDTRVIPDLATPKKTEQISAPAFNDCGKLVVGRPRSLETVQRTASYVTVVASVQTCNTIGVAPDSYDVLIVDSTGMPVSTRMPATVVGNKDYQSFTMSVRLTSTAAAGTGYVLITRTSNTGVALPNEGARIPIRFVN